MKFSLIGFLFNCSSSFLSSCAPHILFLSILHVFLLLSILHECMDRPSFFAGSPQLEFDFSSLNAPDSESI